MEAKFPDAAEFQKFADANGLFIAFQIGELVKQMDRLEDRQLSRTAVTWIAIGVVIAGVTVIAALRTVFKFLGLLD